MDPDKFTIDLVIGMLRAIETKFAHIPGYEYKIKRDYTKELVDMLDNLKRSSSIPTKELENFWGLK